MTRRPRVVLFRHAPIDIDSRAKRFATTLARAGYEPVVISLEAADGRSGEFVLGDDIRVIRVPLTRRPAAQAPEARPEQERTAAARRRRTALRGRITGADARSAKAAAKWSIETARIVGYSVVDTVEKVRRRIAMARAERTERGDPFVVGGVQRNLPVVYDIAHTLVDLLTDLRPDVLHAHHPQVLLAAREAQARLSAAGHEAKLYYDARENFAGIPPLEQGLLAAHEALITAERIMIGKADEVSTVSEPIADVLRETYSLEERPDVFLNMPPYSRHAGETTVREAAGLGPDVPLVVYSGTMSWARGIETLIEGIAHMPAEAHLVVVSVPMPHPMIPKLEDFAREHGVLDRLHFVPPVSQDELLHYLSGADLAVHPLPGGSPNHDAAMPNKLFEYLHAGLPLVVSDAKLMAAFVRDNGVGRVFVSNDAASCGEQIGLALAEDRGSQVEVVARRFSWQGQERAIVAKYNQLTGFDGTPGDPETFGSLQVRAA